MKAWLTRFRSFEVATPYGPVVLEPTFDGSWLTKLVGRIRGVGIALMGAMTNLEEAAYLNYRFRGGVMAQLTNAYIGLFILSPGEAGGGTEVNGFGYSRLAMAQADWAAPTAGEPTTIENSAQKLYAQATGGNWGTVVALGVFDDPTAGVMTHYGTLATSKTINDGDNAKFNAGALKIGQS